MAGGIAVHAVRVVLDGVGHPGGPQRQHLLLRGIDVVDLDVQMELLRSARVGEPRRLVLGGELKREPAPRRLGEHTPRVVFLVQAAAQQAFVETRQRSRVFAVDDDGAQLSDHDVGVAVMPAVQTTSLLNMGMTATACSVCGTEPLENARFCHGCGSPVGSSDAAAEYKQVTVLFADVVHSMDIAAAVGAERLREIMTELVKRASVVVQRYSGTVDKFTGDGIMAVFGAPVALEDHAFRACLAALDLQEQAQQLAIDVNGRDGVDLQLRVGLNSGEVIAGEIGSGAAGYTAIGEQVGLAQRMESAAPPGGVMLSESTARLVDEAVILDEPELVRIKGSELPVSARRLLGVAEHAAIGRRDSTLVGRQWELAAAHRRAGPVDRGLGSRRRSVGATGRRQEPACRRIGGDRGQPRGFGVLDIL